MNENNRTSNRRSVLKSAAGLGTLTALPFTTGTAAAQSETGTGAEIQTTDRYGYQLTEDGQLTYAGADDSGYISDAVAGMNQAKANGKIDFAVEDDQIVTKPTGTSDSITTLSSCSGKDTYESSFSFQGTKYDFFFDHCTTNEIYDLLMVSAAISEIAAVISYALTAVPVAVANQCAAIIFYAAADIVSNNDEGEGIVVSFTIPYSGVGYIGGDIDPQ